MQLSILALLIYGVVGAIGTADVDAIIVFGALFLLIAAVFSLFLNLLVTTVQVGIDNHLVRYERRTLWGGTTWQQPIDMFHELVWVRNKSGRGTLLLTHENPIFTLVLLSEKKPGDSAADVTRLRTTLKKPVGALQFEKL